MGSVTSTSTSGAKADQGSQAFSRRRVDIATAKLARAAGVPVKTARAALFTPEALGAIDAARGSKRVHFSDDLIRLERVLSAPTFVAPPELAHVVAQARAHLADALAQRHEASGEPGGPGLHDHYVDVRSQLDRVKHLGTATKVARKLQALSAPARDELGLRSAQIAAAAHKLSKVVQRGGGLLGGQAAGVSQAAQTLLSKTASSVAQAGHTVLKESQAALRDAGRQTATAARRAEKNIGYQLPVRGNRALVHQQQEQLYRSAHPEVFADERLPRTTVKAWVSASLRGPLAHLDLAADAPWPRLRTALTEYVADLQKKRSTPTTSSSSSSSRSQG